ncbi:hypothetical protein [Rossellomorea marisflavi]|uniref:hypothetical protein n=1 Tax=Rossellomorea TaxID=2837508 RepID=UPI00064FC000|nr:hypothetical protein [Rossellomorea marisflavi]KMK95694.1 hypothetical protein VL03_05740 [Rossellomorea marisflavi]KML02755.1 hypothetical protein VL06_17075 [Rossellomorea marisflavi]QHA38206.1 hypothetical protein D5E69_22105 [Rossellomorea marisflavi]TYO74048.1 hypothetical protein DQ398_000175 [Rossellomorea marisflavi]
MKKLLYALMAGLVLLTSACSIGSSPDKAVEVLYKAALKNDEETYNKIVGGNSDLVGSIDMVAEMVRDMGGVEKLNFETIKKKNLLKEIEEDLDEQYENPWEVVMVSRKSEDEGKEVMIWVMEKVDGDYLVGEVESDYKEDVLK